VRQIDHLQEFLHEMYAVKAHCKWHVTLPSEC